MMRIQHSRLPAVVLATLCLLTLRAGATEIIESPLGPPSQSAPPGRTFIWKVSKDGHELYLGGSVHLLREKDMPLPAKFREVFDKSAVIYFELNPDEAKSPVAALMMQQKGLYTDGGNLRERLSKGTAAKLDEFLTASGYPTNAFDQMRPWFIAINLTVLEAMKHGVNPAYGVESVMGQWAKEKSMPIKAFETMEEQLSLFDKLDDDTQDKLLLSTLADLPKIGGAFDEMIQSWKTGDGDKLAHYIGESMKDYPALNDALLIQRNKNWMPEIEKAIQSGQIAFVVVGAAHLTGKDGLIDLLRQKGYTVEQF